MALGQFDELIPAQTAQQFDSAYTPGTWTLVNALQYYRKRFDTIQICNSDSIAHNVSFDLISQDGTGISGSVHVPANSGFAGNVPVDALAVLFPTNFHYLIAQNNNPIGIMVEEAITSTKFVTVTLLGGAY